MSNAASLERTRSSSRIPDLDALYAEAERLGGCESFMRIGAEYSGCRVDCDSLRG